MGGVREAGTAEELNNADPATTAAARPATFAVKGLAAAPTKNNGYRRPEAPAPQRCGVEHGPRHLVTPGRLTATSVATGGVAAHAALAVPSKTATVVRPASALLGVTSLGVTEPTHAETAVP